MLAGLDLFQRDSRITKENLFIHTVGGPRVGNEAFAKYVGSTGISYYRSVHKHDRKLLKIVTFFKLILTG